MVVLVFVTLLSELSHRIGQDFKASGLAGASMADQHYAKPDIEGFIELDHFLLEYLVVRLQSFRYNRLIELLDELGVVGFDDC